MLRSIGWAALSSLIPLTACPGTNCPFSVVKECGSKLSRCFISPPLNTRASIRLNAYADVSILRMPTSLKRDGYPFTPSILTFSVIRFCAPLLVVLRYSLKVHKACTAEFIFQKTIAWNLLYLFNTSPLAVCALHVRVLTAEETLLSLSPHLQISSLEDDFPLPYFAVMV